MRQIRALNLINLLANAGFDLNEMDQILDVIKDWSMLLTKEDMKEALVDAHVGVQATKAVQKAMTIQ